MAKSKIVKLAIGSVFESYVIPLAFIGERAMLVDDAKKLSVLIKVDETGDNELICYGNLAAQVALEFRDLGVKVNVLTPEVREFVDEFGGNFLYSGSGSIVRAAADAVEDCRQIHDIDWLAETDPDHEDVVNFNGAVTFWYAALAEACEATGSRKLSRQAGKLHKAWLEFVGSTEPSLNAVRIYDTSVLTESEPAL